MTAPVVKAGPAAPTLPPAVVKARPAMTAPVVKAGPAVPPAAPRGPLELPNCDDSDSSDSSAEDRDYKLDIIVTPTFSQLKYTMRKQLRKAAECDIGVDMCKTISCELMAAEVFDTCVYRIDCERSRLGFTRFKVGISHSPRWRFVDAPYAYLRDNPALQRMQVLWASDCVDEASELETKLIAHYKATEVPGRMNNNPGGESAPKVPPVFVYAVFGFGEYGGNDRQQARFQMFFNKLSPAKQNKYDHRARRLAAGR